MQLLLIKISAIDASPEYALLGKKQKEDRFVPANWSRIKSLGRGRKIVLLVPNNDIVLTTINIPSKNKKQLLQAVPYALEDTLAEDIEKLHFTIHQTPSDNKQTHVAVVSRSQLEIYQSLLLEHGVSPHFVLPQVLSQKIADNTWSIQQYSNSFNVRTNSFSGFSCDKSLLNVFIEPLEKPQTIFSNISRAEIPESLQNISLEKVDASIAHYQSIMDATPLNLLTNFHSKSKNSTSFNWSIWRPTLILASTLSAIYLGTLAWQNNLLKKEQLQLKRSIDSTYKESFPKSRLVDPPQQMMTKLRQLKKNAGKTINSPLPLISDFSPLLKQHKDLSLNEIRYQENELIIVIKSPSLGRLESFKKDAATKSNLKIEIKSSTTTADKVEAILIITPMNSALKTSSLSGLPSSTKVSV